MKKQNDFKETERALNSFPKLKLNQTKQYDIHQNLLADIDKWERAERRGKIMKRVIVGFTSVAAVVLFTFLTFSFKETNDLNQQSSDREQFHEQIGEPEIPFSDIVEGDIAKIVATTGDNSLNKEIYSTNSKELITRFKDSMQDMSFKKTDKSSSVFQTTYELYDQNNRKFSTLVLTGENIITIDGGRYEFDEAKLSSFSETFLTDEYKAVDIMLIDRAKTIVDAIANKDMNTLAMYVHPTNGVLFSPYVNVHKDAVVFTQSQVADLLEDPSQYQWGTFDGSGQPIEFTTKEYYDRFVFDKDFNNAEEINLNPNKQRGNMINNIKDVFPKAQVVEFYIPGSEDTGGLDWKSLNVVFQQDESGSWKLIAIVHDGWTI
jgi:hypothetical protein